MDDFGGFGFDYAPGFYDFGFWSESDWQAFRNGVWEKYGDALERLGLSRKDVYAGLNPGYVSEGFDVFDNGEYVVCLFFDSPVPYYSVLWKVEYPGYSDYDYSEIEAGVPLPDKGFYEAVAQVISKYRGISNSSGNALFC